MFVRVCLCEFFRFLYGQKRGTWSSGSLDKLFFIKFSVETNPMTFTMKPN